MIVSEYVFINMEIYNKNVDIKFSAHYAFLEPLSSGTLKVEKLQGQIILKSLGSLKP